MSFIVKKHNKEEFYPTYCKWSEVHGFPIMNSEVLPELVFVSYNDDIPVYAMWYWFTDSKISVLGFLMSNKNVNYKLRIGGKEVLFSRMIEYAKKKKQLMLYCPTTSKSVIDVIKEFGFFQGDTDSSQYFLQLK
jgi:hypothetical protein